MSDAKRRATTHAGDVDFEPFSADTLRRVAEPLRRVFAPVAIGLEHVPREGAVLLAGNHTIYGLIDIPMLGIEILNGSGRLVRGLGDHNHFAVPLWRDVLRRLGAVRGTRDNCAALFERGEAVLVFPGGGREVMKRKGERYKLVWKERVGFARLAIEHGVPIVPFATDQRGEPRAIDGDGTPRCDAGAFEAPEPALASLAAAAFAAVFALRGRRARRFRSARVQGTSLQ